MPTNMTAKIEWLNGAIWSRETWLRDHANTGKWPSHDVDDKRRGLAIMTEMRDDYQKSIDRSKAAAE